MSACRSTSSAPLVLKFLAAPPLVNAIVRMPWCRSLTWAFWLSSSQENRRMVLTRSRMPGHRRRTSTSVSPVTGSREGGVGAGSGGAVGDSDGDAGTAEADPAALGGSGVGAA